MQEFSHSPANGTVVHTYEDIMKCCSTKGAAKFFSKNSRRYARTFKRKGLDKAQQVLADGLSKLGIRGNSVLEIGCGVGGLHISLLDAGAVTAYGIDVSAEMVEKAKEFASERGHANKVSYVVGDFLEMNGNLPVSDIVIMDKVLCCTYRPIAMITETAKRTKKYFAVSYPSSRFLPRLMFSTSEYVGKVFGWSFHPWYHRPELLEEEIRRAEFSEVFSERTWLWQAKIFVKK